MLGVLAGHLEEAEPGTPIIRITAASSTNTASRPVVSTSVVIAATPSATGGSPPICSISQHKAEAILRIPPGGRDLPSNQS
jgi:hypothetical protein